MKKTIAFCIAFLATVACVAADDALLASIKKANSTEKYNCPFTQAKYMKMMSKPIESAGTVYLQGADNMSMIYSKPEGDLLVIAEGQFIMVNKGKTRKHNVKEGSQMRTLRNTLLLSMRGDVNGIAEETNSTVSRTSSATTDDFEISRREQVKIGYDKIKLSFDKNTHLLTEMIMEEPNGNYTVYKLGKYDFSGSFGNDVFNLPK